MTAPLDELCRSAQAGDRRAVEALVRALQDPLYRLALRFLSLPEPARDATQEILILVVTQLSTFRGDSAVTTWAYRIAARYLMRLRRRSKRYRFESLEAELGQPAPSEAIVPSAEQRLLEEEIFLGCTQAMLGALDRPLRIAFVLGGILELESSEASRVLEISEPAFRKRLSRARSLLDAFVAKHCGVANPAAPCRCGNQLELAKRQKRLDEARPRFALPAGPTSLEALSALGELRATRRSLELYRAQPVFRAPEDFALELRRILQQAPTLTHC